MVVNMTGILAVNHFLTGEKFDTLHRHLVSTAEKMNIHLVPRTNMELALDSNINADFVLFWDKDLSLIHI